MTRPRFFLLGMGCLLVWCVSIGLWMEQQKLDLGDALPPGFYRLERTEKLNLVVKRKLKAEEKLDDDVMLRDFQKFFEERRRLEKEEEEDELYVEEEISAEVLRNVTTHLTKVEDVSDSKVNLSASATTFEAVFGTTTAATVSSTTPTTVSIPTESSTTSEPPPRTTTEQPTTSEPPPPRTTIEPPSPPMLPRPRTEPPPTTGSPVTWWTEKPIATTEAALKKAITVGMGKWKHREEANLAALLEEEDWSPQKRNAKLSEVKREELRSRQDRTRAVAKSLVSALCAVVIVRSLM